MGNTRVPGIGEQLDALVRGELGLLVHTLDVVRAPAVAHDLELLVERGVEALLMLEVLRAGVVAEERVEGVAYRLKRGAGHTRLPGACPRWWCRRCRSGRAHSLRA
jgi:hypothetical protein